MTRDEAKKLLLNELDIAASVTIKKYPILDSLDIYNTLQLLSWKIIENQPSQSSAAIFKKDR